MLFTPEHQDRQKRLHKSTTYGKTAGKYGVLINQIVNTLKVTHLLDYGCGSKLPLKEVLAPQHEFTYQCYDPGVDKFSASPSPAQMVVCCDVLEHIEPECLEDVLDHLEELCEEVIFISVHTGPAGKSIDGKNVHLIQNPMEWWFPKLAERFQTQTLQRASVNEFYYIGNALG